MSTLSHRTTVYLKPNLHKALRAKAFETSCSISELINDAVHYELLEDIADLEAFDERKNEPSLSYEEVIKDLVASGKL